MDIKNRVKIDLSKDGSQCKVTILPAEEGMPEIEIMDFIEYLNSQNIIYGLDESAIMENVILANSSTEPITFVAATAIPPIKGKEASIDVLVNLPFEKNKITENKKSFYLSGFTVSPEQQVLIIDNNNLEGIDGTTVEGKPIKAQSSDKTRITAGRNIKISENEKKIYYKANTSGKLHLDNNKIIYVQPFQDGYFSIRTSDDNLRLYLSLFPPRNEGRFPGLKEILLSFQDQNIPLDDKKILTIKKLLYQLALIQRPIEDEILIQGQAPQHGENAKIIFKVKTEPEKIFQDSDEQIDFYEIMKINEVKEGDLLAVKIPPTPAVQNGVDIYGKTIPAEDGKDIQGFEIGKNVIQSDDGLSFYAQISGQVKFTNNILRVIPVYIVEGDVNFSTGNVRFSGDIIIKGNVLDNFEVYSDETITVYNNIGAAKIYAGNNLVVKNGIINKKKSDILVKGNLRTRFIENSSVVVKGDIFVEDYILQSDVESHSNITVSTFKKGQIIGSSVIAKKSVSARSLGNSNEILTNISVGLQPIIEKKLKILKFNITNIQHKLASSTQQSLDAQTISELETKLHQLLEKQTKYMNLQGIKTDCLIKVKDEIYPNCELNLNDKTILIKKLTTFRKFVYDLKNETIMTKEYH